MCDWHRRESRANLGCSIGRGWRVMLRSYLRRVMAGQKWNIADTEGALTRHLPIAICRYVLITDIRCGDGRLPRVFLHHEGLARFCTTPYEEPTEDNLGDNTRHLSNYSVSRCHFQPRMHSLFYNKEKNTQSSSISRFRARACDSCSFHPGV